MTDKTLEKRTILVFSLLFVLLTLLLYSYLIFWYLPPAQLMKYTRAAQMYLNNQLSGERLLDFSPAYFYLHVFIQSVFSDPILVVSWIHILLQALSTAILFNLLARWVRLPVAIFGTLAFMLEIHLIVYNQVFEPEALLLFFLLSFVFFAFRTGWRQHALAGLFLGLGILTRPNFFPLLFVVPFHFYFRQNLQGKMDFRKLGTSVIAFSIPVVVAILGLWIRNAAIVGYFSPMVMDPGTVIFEGNNPVSHGQSSIYPHLVDDVAKQYSGEPDYHHEIYRVFARRIMGKQLTVPEVNTYWSGKAFNFLVDHPAHLIRLICTKVFHIFHRFQWHDLSNAYWGEQQLQLSLLPAAPFALISALALSGMFLMIHRWKQYLLYYAIFFVQFASMLAVYPSARQRVAIIPILLFFACSAVDSALHTRKRLLLLAIVIIPLFLVLHIETDIMKEERHLWQNIRNSNHFLRDARQKRSQGQLRQASLDSAVAYALAPWFRDSRRLSDLSFEPRTFELAALQFLHPQNFSQRLDYAILLLEAGQAARAAATLKELIQEGYEFKRDQYQSSSPYFYLARAATVKGDIQKARTLLAQALIETPGDPDALAYLAVFTEDRKYRQQLFRYFDDLDANFYLGRAYLENNRGKNAADCFQFIVEKLPDYRRAKIYLAAALRSKQIEKAAGVFREAVLKSWDPLFLEPQILDLFSELSETKPRDAFAHYSYGIVLRKFGHYSEALKALEEAQTLDPKNVHISNELKAVREFVKANQK